MTWFLSERKEEQALRTFASQFGPGSEFYRIVLPAAGYSLLRFWIMLTGEDATVFPTSPSFFLTFWLARGVFPLLVVVLLNSHSLTEKLMIRTMGVSIAMSVLGGFLLVVSHAMGVEATVVLGTVIGLAGMGWVYVCWSEVYRYMRIRDVAISIMLSLVLSTVASGVSVYLPIELKLACVVVIPMVAAVMFVDYLRRSPHGKAAPVSRHDEGWMIMSNGKWFAMLALYSFVIGAIHVISSSQEGAGQDERYYEIYIVASLVLASLFLVGVLSHKLPSLKLFWLGVVGAVGASLVLVLAFNAMLQIILSVFAAVRYVAFGYINIKFVDIARHSRSPIYVVFAAGWGVMQICMALGAGVVLYGFDSLGLNLDVIATLLLAILAMGTLLITNNSELSDVFIGDGREEESGQEEGGTEAFESESIEELLTRRCRALRKNYGLTEREAEIVFLLAQGHTQVYCAEALVVSINTVRSHMKHIYAKLDIHSKDELLQVLNGSSLQQKS